MANCKLVALDIDGTLTNSKKVIPQDNIDALMQLQQKGVRLALASGRPTFGIRHLAAELKMAEYNGLIMAYNGARVVDCATDSTIESLCIPRDLLVEICKASVEYDAPFATYDDVHDTILTQTSGNKWIEHEAMINNNMKLQAVSDINLSAPDMLHKCLMVGEPDYLATVEPKMQARFPQLAIYRSAPFFLEIVPQGVDKAQTLDKVGRKLGIAASQMAAFGDGYNDVSMIAYAGVGVAMANGCDEARNAADFVSISNDDCGVAYAIRQLGL
ncbi:MAG: Cof-type HAD-IIB family hydrolase [Bacteroidales bacterium]|nr:Cof-type HAD-IIB family hydrolase [Bacteroidales bacterium]